MSNSSSVTEKIKILLIGGEDALALSIKEYFNKHNDEVEYLGWGKTGQEGVSKAKNFNPHIVLVAKPSHDMNTKEVVHLIRASSESIKIMTMSESNNPQWIGSTIDAGANDYISQPTAGLGVEDHALLDNMHNAIKKLHYHLGSSLREEMKRRK